MQKTTIGIIVALILGFIGYTTWSVAQQNEYTRRYEKYDLNTVNGGDENNGGIADHVKGNPDAPIMLFEYADYQCPGCSTINPWVNELIEEYDGKVAVTFRVVLLDYHPNARAAASAVEAAGLQGYWKQYGDMLFANQSEWENLTGTERQNMFNEYFAKVSNGKGDITKFVDDIASDEVKAKISYDIALNKRVKVDATPALYLDGELIDWYEENTKAGFLQYMHNTIENKLKSLGIE